MMLVPFAIKEAEKLYSKHMYVSLALWQMWRTREEYIHSESGLEHLSGTDDVSEALSKWKPRLKPLLVPSKGAGLRSRGRI